MKNFTIGYSRKNESIEKPKMDDIHEFLVNISGEVLYTTYANIILGEFLSWTDYRHHMYQLCRKYPDVYFSIIILDLVNPKIRREIFINDLVSFDKPTITYGKLEDLEFEEINSKYKEEVIYDNTINFEPILKALRKSDSSVDIALYHALVEWMSHFKDIPVDYFHKAFRQADVMDTEHKDGIMWHLLNASKTFWKVLDEQ